ncbi:MAG: selenocysteine-specific translation elongation factor [Xanthobacteraceae bacterium]|nr:selenocysteine-specific translation elongation factor [Xanthobacteraceae bacterium]
MIVGTAGHIDHGKTALVRALTGVDADRLKEEKIRGISIDLGFAYLPVENGSVGFVDVPGHHRFIRNMLAGVAGIDYALLVVAANEGVKPQTEEHLQILDLLGISRGVIALTKSDLVSHEQCRLVSEQISRRLRHTSLSGAPVFPVSILTGRGIDPLRQLIVNAHHEDRPLPENTGRFRMPVDRCFTLTGAGTVVTGTVTGGRVTVGDQLLISPSGIKAQVRSIHAQNRKVEAGQRGDRCALNIVGSEVSREAISRGDVILDPVLHFPTDRIDVRLRFLEAGRRPLSQWTPVKLHHGTTEVVGHTVALSDKPLSPGDEGFIQLVLERPIAAVAGDRFVLRDSSDQHTIGGGRFIDLRAPARRRRSIQRMTVLAGQTGTSAAEALRNLLSIWPYFVSLTAFGRDYALTQSAIDALVCEAKIVVLSYGTEEIALAGSRADRLAKDIMSVLETHHRCHAEQIGLGFEKLRNSVEPRLPAQALHGFLRRMVNEKSVVIDGSWVRHASHLMHLTSSDEQTWKKIVPILEGQERFQPPKVRELGERLSRAERDMRCLLKTLAKMGKIYEISHDHFFSRDVISEVLDVVVDITGRGSGRVTAAELRDRLDNGRRIAIELLEFFDRRGVTIRRGDFRILNRPRLDAFRANNLKVMAVASP